MAPTLLAPAARRLTPALLALAWLGWAASPVMAKPAKPARQAANAWTRPSPSDWLRSRMGGADDFRAAAAPAVARYRTDEGTVFVLDRSEGRPLIKFEANAEVWALSPERGPRGDIIYRNDAGEPVLRATRLGGMTVFTPRRPEGAAASLDGSSAPLHLAPLGPVALYQRLFQTSVRCTRIAGRLIGFDAPDVSPSSDALIGDAAAIVATAFADLAVKPGGKAKLARIGRVALLEGRHAAVSYRKGVVTITVAPAEGVAGRPSSERVVEALAR